MASFSKTARRPSHRVAGMVVAGLLAIAALCSCKSGSGEPAAETASPGQADASVSAGTYVALGDSYAAAPLAAGEDANPAGCLRSDEDYPVLVARALRPRSFVNVSCYGASTYQMTHQENTLDQDNPPQLSALSAADSLVTMQVGGDDVDFTKIIITCAGLSLSDPFGSPCENHYTAGGTDQLAQAIARAAPKISAVLADIRQRAPHARILLIGYPDLLPTQGDGCWPLVPVAHGDVAYLRGVEIGLNTMLAAAAAKAGVGYVDTYDGSIGHDACTSAGVKWVEGLIPTSLAFPLHPNAAGEQAVAKMIIAMLG